MTTSFHSTRSLLLAALLTVAAAPALSQGTPEQEQACAPDAIRLCPDTIPDVGRTTACMERHKAELTPRCRRAFDTATNGTGDEAAPAPRRHRYSERSHRVPDYVEEQAPPPRDRSPRGSTLIEDDQVIVRELPDNEIYVYRR